MLKDIIIKFHQILTRKDQHRALIILFISFISAILDTVGIASIFPFMTVATNPESILTNQTIAFVYNQFHFNNPHKFLLLLGYASLFLILFSIVFRAFTTWMQLKFIYKLEFNLSSRLFKYYLLQNYDWFLNRHSAELSKQVLTEVQQVIQGILTPLIQFFTNVILAIAIVIMTFLVEPLLMSVLFSILGFSYFLSYQFSIHFLKRISEERFIANQTRHNVVSEALSSIKDIKSTGVEEVFLEKYDQNAFKYANKYVQAQVVAQAPRFFLEAIVFGGFLTLLLFILAETTSITEIVPTVSLLVFAGYRLIPALQIIFSCLVSLRFLLPSLKSIHYDLISYSHSFSDQKKQKNYDIEFSKRILLKNIIYCYPFTEKRVIDNLYLEIPFGQIVSIIGSTGSGKTTILDLILGLLSPKSGEIFIDEIILNQHNVDNWKIKIGYVSQQVFLIDDTILANIAFGIPSDLIDFSAVKTAATMAMIHNFINDELPKGYDTTVGERGVRLSGGQRQRIGIARALYRNPNLIIFDESTSALDSKTAYEIMQSINNLRGKVTIVMVSHHMSSIRQSDLIYLIDNGKVIAKGNFNNLLESNKFFQTLNLNS